MFEHTSSALVRVVERASTWENINATCNAYIHGAIQSVYEKLFLMPLARLYLYGPSLGGWGFWNGIKLHVICAQKTNLLPDFWEHHPFECAQLVSKQFYSSIILIETFVYFYLFWCSIKYVLHLIQNKCTRKS